MSNPLTEARKSLPTTAGALRSVLPRSRPALTAIRPVARVRSVKPRVRA